MTCVYVTQIGSGENCAAGGEEIQVWTDPTDTCATFNPAAVTSTAYVCNAATDGGPAASTIGGTLSGLPRGDTIVLELNGGYDLTLAANGPFTFPETIASGASYSVTIASAPGYSDDESCGVASSAGTVGATNVTSVDVTCSPIPLCGDASVGLNGFCSAPGICVSLGYSDYTCLQSCTSNATCPSGSVCGNDYYETLASNSSTGEAPQACSALCDPVLNTLCSGSTGCYLTEVNPAASGSTQATFAPICLEAGTTTQGQPCSQIADGLSPPEVCARGLQCLLGKCAALCNPGDSSTCPSGTSCDTSLEFTGYQGTLYGQCD